MSLNSSALHSLTTYEPDEIERYVRAYLSIQLKLPPSVIEKENWQSLQDILVVFSEMNGSK